MTNLVNRLDYILKNRQLKSLDDLLRPYELVNYLMPQYSGSPRTREKYKNLDLYLTHEQHLGNFVLNHPAVPVEIYKNDSKVQAALQLEAEESPDKSKITTKSDVDPQLEKNRAKAKPVDESHQALPKQGVTERFKAAVAVSHAKNQPIPSLKSNYKQMINGLAENIKLGTNRWIAGGPNSKKVQMLNRLHTFISNQDDAWINEQTNQDKLLAVIKSICKKKRNPVSIFSPASHDEFIDELDQHADKYGANLTANDVHSISFAELLTLSSSDSTSNDIQQMFDSIQLESSHRSTP